jgi:hypothetical protein
MTMSLCSVRQYKCTVRFWVILCSSFWKLHSRLTKIYRIWILCVTAIIGHAPEIAETEALLEGHFHFREYYIAITVKENSIYFSK